MSYKSILVNLSGPRGRPYAQAIAISLAREFSAHLEGVYVYEPPYYRYEFAYGSIADELKAQDKKAREAAEKAIRQFRAQAQQAGVENTEWYYTGGDLFATLERRSRGADFVVTEQLAPDENNPRISPDLPAVLAIACGCPVLVVPQKDIAAVPKRALIAWNGSREAARAVVDALPLLKRADAVQILIAPKSTDKTESYASGDIQRLLRHHGVTARIAEAKNFDGHTTTSVILSHAHSFKADLICIGAYGHSRLRELTLGGVTWHMLRESTVPLFMSH